MKKLHTRDYSLGEEVQLTDISNKINGPILSNNFFDVQATEPIKNRDDDTNGTYYMNPDIQLTNI